MPVKKATGAKRPEPLELLGAVIEGANQSNRGLSPPLRGGVAARTGRCREASAASRRRGGVSSRRYLYLLTTPSAPSKVASRHFLSVASTPPRRGGETA